MLIDQGYRFIDIIDMSTCSDYLLFANLASSTCLSAHSLVVEMVARRGRSGSPFGTDFFSRKIVRRVDRKVSEQKSDEIGGNEKCGNDANRNHGFVRQEACAKCADNRDECRGATSRTMTPHFRGFPVISELHHERGRPRVTFK